MAPAKPALEADDMTVEDEPLLSVRNLHTYFAQDEGTVKAVDGVSLDMNAGATLGIVGQGGQSTHRGDPSPPGGRPPRGARQGDRDAAPGRRLIARPAGGPAGLPVERRSAPARHDRDGTLVQSDLADRGRANHRARRDHPDADPRAAAPAPPARRAGA